MEHLYKLVIEVYVLQIIQLLKNKVAGIVKNITARMFAGCFPESFERGAIVQGFARVYFITKVDTGFIKCIENGQPSFRELLESIFHNTGWALRPWIDRMPK